MKILPLNLTDNQKKGDTVAAGDGFVSGFLFKFIENSLIEQVNFNHEMPYPRSLLDECVNYGNLVAGMVIMNEGAAI